MSFASRVPNASSASPPSPARNACATRVDGGRTTTLPRRTGCRSSSPSSSVPLPSSSLSREAARTGSCLVERRVEVSAKQAGEVVGLILLNEVTGVGQDL